MFVKCIRFFEPFRAGLSAMRRKSATTNGKNCFCKSSMWVLKNAEFYFESVEKVAKKLSAKK
jgi:hypothetical protein